MSESQKINHVAIVMDGNRRWAKKNGLSMKHGWEAGIRNIESIAIAAKQAGIKHLTLFAFSTENWQRPLWQINDLADIVNELLMDQMDKLLDLEFDLKLFGNDKFENADPNEGLVDQTKKKITLWMVQKKFTQIRQRFDEKVQTVAEDKKDAELAMTINVGLNYGSKADITNACAVLAAECVDGQLTPDKITDQVFQNQLSTKGAPALDLLIRTGGEQRLSNFLLWEAAYSELYFSKVLWPDFSPSTFQQAIASYKTADRNFGH